MVVGYVSLRQRVSLNCRPTSYNQQRCQAAISRLQVQIPVLMLSNYENFIILISTRYGTNSRIFRMKFSCSRGPYSAIFVRII